MVVAKDYYKFIQENPTVFEGGHNVPTPQELVESVAGTVDYKDKTILVMFNVEFVVSLVYTYKVDPASITFYADHPRKIKMAAAMGVKYITNLDTDMKFDVVLANPPYNDSAGDNRLESKNTNNSNLYVDFINKSLELCPDGTVSMIVPAAWMQHAKMSKKIKDAGLEFVASVDRKHFPGVGIRSGISNFQVTAGYTGDINIIAKDTTYTVSRQDTLSFSDPLRFNIVNKVKTHAHLNTVLNVGPYKIPKGVKGSVARLIPLDPSYSLTETATHNQLVLVYVGGDRKQASYVYSTTPCTETRYGLVIPGISDTYILGKLRQVPPGLGVSEKLWVMYFDSQDKAANAEAYLSSKLVRFIIRTTKHNDTVNTNKNSIGNIPLVDFDRAYTDEELYTLFNLTQEEIDCIENDFK